MVAVSIWHHAQTNNCTWAVELLMISLTASHLPFYLACKSRCYSDMLHFHFTERGRYELMAKETQCTHRWDLSERAYAEWNAWLPILLKLHIGLMFTCLQGRKASTSEFSGTARFYKASPSFGIKNCTMISFKPHYSLMSHSVSCCNNWSSETSSTSAPCTN